MTNANTARALAMIAADLYYRAGDDSAVEVLYELIVELVDPPGDGDDLYETFCALVQLAGTAFTRFAAQCGIDPTEHFQAIALSMANE